MRRFFVPDLPTDDTFPLPDALRHRLTQVLRTEVGDTFEVLTDDGRCHQLKCCGDDSGCLVVRRLTVEVLSDSPPAPVTVFQCVPKGRKLDQIVQDCTELGAQRLVPVFSERTVVRWESNSEERRLQRMNRIALHAAEQSRRAVPLQVAPPCRFEEALEAGSPAGRVLLDTSREAPRFGSRATELEPPVSLLVGPEGGFSPAEAAAACDHGWQCLSLGPRVLRTETAAVVALAILFDRWEW